MNDDRDERYTLPAIALHWLQAAGIVWLLWLGWTMVDLPKGPERAAAHVLHKSLGLTMLLLAAARLGWRASHATPAEPGSGWEATAARWMHRALYAFLFLAPLSGYLATAFTPYALKFYGLELPRLAAADESLHGIFKELHGLAAWTIAAFASLHVVAALKHARAGDGIMRRMLPRRLLKN